MELKFAAIILLLSLSLVICDTETDEFDDGVIVEDENVSHL